jgi:hypothetical protein
VSTEPAQLRASLVDGGRARGRRDRQRAAVAQPARRPTQTGVARTTASAYGQPSGSVNRIGRTLFALVFRCAPLSPGRWLGHTVIAIRALLNELEKLVCIVAGLFVAGTFARVTWDPRGWWCENTPLCVT